MLSLESNTQHQKSTRMCRMGPHTKWICLCGWVLYEEWPPEFCIHALRRPIRTPCELWYETPHPRHYDPYIRRDPLVNRCLCPFMSENRDIFEGSGQPPVPLIPNRPAQVDPDVIPEATQGPPQLIDPTWQSRWGGLSNGWRGSPFSIYWIRDNIYVPRN